LVFVQSRRGTSVAMVTDPEADDVAAGPQGRRRPRVVLRTLDGKDDLRPVVGRSGRVGSRVRVVRLTDAGRSMLAAAAAAGATIEDTALAVPPFTGAERAIITQPLLSAADNAGAIAWNNDRHPARSGVGPNQIATALARYVDLDAVKAAIAEHNAAAP